MAGTIQTEDRTLFVGKTIAEWQTVITSATGDPNQLVRDLINDLNGTRLTLQQVRRVSTRRLEDAKRHFAVLLDDRSAHLMQLGRIEERMLQELESRYEADLYHWTALCSNLAANGVAEMVQNLLRYRENDSHSFNNFALYTTALHQSVRAMSVSDLARRLQELTTARNSLSFDVNVFNDTRKETLKVEDDIAQKSGFRSTLFGNLALLASRVAPAATQGAIIQLAAPPPGSHDRVQSASTGAIVNIRAADRQESDNQGASAAIGHQETTSRYSAARHDHQESRSREASAATGPQGIGQQESYTRLGYQKSGNEGIDIGADHREMGHTTFSGVTTGNQRSATQGMGANADHQGIVHQGSGGLNLSYQGEGRQKIESGTSHRSMIYREPGVKASQNSVNHEMNHPGSASGHQDGGPSYQQLDYQRAGPQSQRLKPDYPEKDQKMGGTFYEERGYQKYATAYQRASDQEGGFAYQEARPQILVGVQKMICSSSFAI